MITKELINSEVEKLRKELIAKLEEPKLEEPKFEIGKWYIATCDNIEDYLILLDSIDSNGEFVSKCWFTPATKSYRDYKGMFTKIQREAPPSEVQSALEAEAVKRGFKDDSTRLEVSFNYIKNGYIDKMTCGKFKWFNEENEFSCGGRVIFKDGVWATIIPQEKTSEEWVKAFQNDGLPLITFLNTNNLKITKK